MKEDGVTPADPFDRGAGSIRADLAVNSTVTFDVTPAEYFASAADPLNRIHLNLPSINASPMTGVLTTTRRGLNVSGETQPFKVSTTAPEGVTIDVSPKNPVADKDGTLELTITINATGKPNGQYFGEIRLDPNKGGFNDVVMPVAFRKAPGQVTFLNACSPTTIALGASADCTVQARNFASVPSLTSILVTGPQNGQLTIQDVSAPGVPLGSGRNGFSWSGTLSPALPPTITALTVPGGSPAGGYLPLSVFGIAPGRMGDETIVNFTVTPFKYGQESYTRIGFTSNGYAVVGGGLPRTWSSFRRRFRTRLSEQRAGPVLDRPAHGSGWCWVPCRNVDGRHQHLAHRGLGERVRVHGSRTAVLPDLDQGRGDRDRGHHVRLRRQHGPGDPEGLNVGAENRTGTSGRNLGSIPASNSDLRVVTAGPTAGGSVSINYKAFGRNAGVFDNIAVLTSDVMNGSASEKTTITVTP